MSVSRRALLAVLAIAVAAALLPAAGRGRRQELDEDRRQPQIPRLPRQADLARASGCLGSRTVKMYREKSGKKKQLGKDTSEDNGKWAIPVGKNLTSGAYYATVAKRGKCKAAKSQVLTID